MLYNIKLKVSKACIFNKKELTLMLKEDRNYPPLVKAQ